MYMHANRICRSYSGKFAGEHNDRASMVCGGLGVKTCHCPSIGTRTWDPDDCFNFTRPPSMATPKPAAGSSSCSGALRRNCRGAVVPAAAAAGQRRPPAEGSFGGTCPQTLAGVSQQLLEWPSGDLRRRRLDVAPAVTLRDAAEAHSQTTSRLGRNCCVPGRETKLRAGRPCRCPRQCPVPYPL